MNYHPVDCFNFFMKIHSKIQAHPNEVTISYFTSCTNNKLLLMMWGQVEVFIQTVQIFPLTN